MKIHQWTGTALFLASACAATSALLEQANTLYRESRIPEAIPLYKQAVAKGENPALCYFNLGNAYFQIDSLSRAVVYYRACVYHAPDFFKGHLNLAVVYYTLDELGECIAALARALEIEPGDMKAQMVLAAAYRRAGANRESAALFQRIAEEHPDRDDAYIALAEVYRDLDDPVEAVSWLLRYPQTGDKLVYVHQLLAEIYEGQGDREKALYYLREVFNDDPSRRWVLYRMVLLQESMGNDHVAFQEARRGVELFPDFADMALVAGNLAFRLVLYEQAERYYTRARDLGSAGAVVGLENVRVVRMDEQD